MKCRKCKENIPEGSAFCNHCGAPQKKEKKATHAIKVPTPELLPSGNWRIRLKAEGRSVTDADRETCISKARAIRAGWIATNQTSAKMTLSAAIDRFIADRQSVLSPSTIRGYRGIQKNRFQHLMQKPLSTTVNWQAAINKESEVVAPHTVSNAWGLVTVVMRENGLEVPNVRLPKKAPNKKPWLTYEDIPKFLDAIKGDPAEIAALLALHSLRLSELLALTWAKVSDTSLSIAGAKVQNEDNEYVLKRVNKTVRSTRTVPIMIPRLKELFSRQKSSVAAEDFVVSIHPSTIRKYINAACRKAELPEVGIHGLRHSFASLGYHLGMSEGEIMDIGGWDDYATVRNIYRHLAASDKNAAANKMTAFYQSNSK